MTSTGPSAAGSSGDVDTAVVIGRQHALGAKYDRASRGHANECSMKFLGLFRWGESKPRPVEVVVLIHDSLLKRTRKDKAQQLQNGNLLLLNNLLEREFLYLLPDGAVQNQPCLRWERYEPVMESKS